jgi:predicted LPLAT superfamily acyltransferase
VLAVLLCEGRRATSRDAASAQAGCHTASMTRARDRPVFEDLRSLMLLTSGYAATAIVPRRFDAPIVTRVLSGPLLVRERWVRLIAERMRLVLQPFLPDVDYHALATAYCQMFRENEWMRWRAMHGGVVPVSTTVVGLPHLEAAREKGRGVILWGMSFCETLVVKMGLHRSGVALVHLSTANHGAAWPPTPLGLRVVAPLHIAAETPYLAERVVIPVDQSLGYMRVLMDRLAANRCVSIAGDGVARRQNVAATVLGREAHFAPGAPGLAWKMGSALLPLHVVREEPLRYCIVIDEEIAVDRGLEKSAFIDRAVGQFARRLERRVLEHPADWAWYSHMVLTWMREMAGAQGEIGCVG